MKAQEMYERTRLYHKWARIAEFLAEEETKLCHKAREDGRRQACDDIDAGKV